MTKIVFGQSYTKLQLHQCIGLFPLANVGKRGNFKRKFGNPKFAIEIAMISLRDINKVATFLRN